MAKKRFDLSDPIVAQALKILAAQYDKSDMEHSEILRGDFCHEEISPESCIAAISHALRSAPGGWALVNMDEYTLLPVTPTEEMLQRAWPDIEIHNGNFDKEGAYADLIAMECRGPGVIHG